MNGIERLDFVALAQMGSELLQRHPAETGIVALLAIPVVYGYAALAIVRMVWRAAR